MQCYEREVADGAWSQKQCREHEEDISDSSGEDDKTGLCYALFDAKPD